MNRIYPLYPLENLTPEIILAHTYDPIFWQALPVFLSKTLNLEVKVVPASRESRILTKAEGRHRSSAKLSARTDLCALMYLMKKYLIGIPDLQSVVGECLLSGNPSHLTQFVLRKLVSVDIDEYTKDFWSQLTLPATLDAINTDNVRSAHYVRETLGFTPLPISIRSELSLSRYIPVGLLSTYLVHNFKNEGYFDRPIRSNYSSPGGSPGRIPKEYKKLALGTLRRAEVILRSKNPDSLKPWARDYTKPTNPIFIELPGTGISPMPVFNDHRPLSEIARLATAYRGGVYLKELGFLYQGKNRWINLNFVMDALRAPGTCLA